ncbi:MAG: tetratricopeptide repeat protein [Bacteroidota bacterium]
MRTLRACFVMAFAIVLAPSLTFAQTRVLTRADSLAREAMLYMDGNLPQSAITAWDMALKEVPGYVPFLYEKAVALVMAERHREAIELIEPIHRDTLLRDRGYQLLGNCYDILEDTSSARRYYQDGIKAFPTSGRLHFEIGQLFYRNNDRDKAQSWWLAGTRAEPSFATNYYWLAKFFSETRERIWSAFYGELFLNIERNSPRTREISKLVFDMWNLSMRVGDSTDPMRFCSDEAREVPDPRGGNMMSFLEAFEFTMAQAAQTLLTKDTVINRLGIEQLVDLRYRFMRGWISSGKDTTYPNELLSWNAWLLKQGRLKDYLWWLYAYGDKREMNLYFRKNADRYDTFLVWFAENSLLFDKPKCVGLGCP